MFLWECFDDLREISWDNAGRSSRDQLKGRLGSVWKGQDHFKGLLMGSVTRIIRGHRPVMTMR